MKRQIKFSLLLSAALAIISAPLARSADLPKCCVWRVTNAKAPFYLVGSVHALSPRDYPLPAPYEIALKDSKQLIFEMNPKLSDEFANQFEAAGKYPRGQDITTRLHPKALAWMRQHLQSVKFQYNKTKKKYDVLLGSFDQSKQFRAWYLAENYVGFSSFSDVRYKYGVDNHLADQARKSGKEIGGLESVGQHVAVFGGMSDADGQIVLLDRIVYSQQDDASWGRLRSAWRHGNVDALWKLDARLRNEAFWIAQRLVDNRNIKWLPRIEAEIKSGKPTAIVAGALHFAGPNSVVTLLQKRGYKVEQL